MLERLFGQKCGKWKCPRCKTEQWFKTKEAFDEVLQKGFDTCMESFALIKLSVEGKKVKVERLSEQSYADNEPQLTDADYDLLKRMVGSLKGLEMMASGMGYLQLGSVLEGDYPGAIYWDIKGKQFGGNPLVKKTVENIAYLLEKYPRQTRRYFANKGKTEYCPKSLP